MSEKRIPSLDGIRAIAIGMVILCHLGATLTTHYKLNFRLASHAIATAGFLGVTMFFVISGYLISTLLFREIAVRGTISLRRFYFRRTLRLLPAYYALIAVITAAYLTGVVKTNGWYDILFHALTYTTNYNHTFFWYLGHSWTLSVEEQFYLLWPIVLLVLGKHRGLVGLSLLLVACPIVRAYYATLPEHYAVWNWTPQLRFESVADSLAAGCLLAGGSNWLKHNVFYGAFRQSWMFVLFPSWIFLAWFVPLPAKVEAIGHTITIISIAGCVDWAISFPNTHVGRFLNARPAVFVGVLSYSLYLWQQPFLDPYTRSIISYFPLNVFLVCVAALGSFYCIERPGLALRNRIGKILFDSDPNHSSETIPPVE